MLERSNIEVTDEDCALRLLRTQLGMAAHFIEEIQLVPEFRIDRWIGLVAAGRNVKVVQGDWVVQLRALAQNHRDMPAVGLTAETLDVDLFKRNAREDCHAVIALLPAESRVLVTKPLETLERKSIVGTFRLLQA